MSKFADFLTNVLSGTIESVGESKLIEALQQLHDTNKVQYKAALYGGTALVEALSSLVQSSPSKLDDAMLSAIEDAIRISANNNGIDLLAKPSE